MFRRIKRFILCLMYIGFAAGLLVNPNNVLIQSVYSLSGITPVAWMAVFTLSALAMLIGAIMDWTVFVTFYAPLFVYSMTAVYLGLRQSGNLSPGTVIFLSLISYIMVDYAGEVFIKWIDRKP